MKNLPQLPRQMKKREAKIDSKVLEWFSVNYPTSVAVEVKIKGNKLKPHQELSLNEVQGGAYYFKIPDMGRRNPFDGFVLKNANAFTVTCDGRKCHAVRKDNEEEFDFSVK